MKNLAVLRRSQSKATLSGAYAVHIAQFPWRGLSCVYRSSNNLTAPASRHADLASPSCVAARRLRLSRL